MNIQNFINNMSKTSHNLELKLSRWKSKKKKGSKGEQITRDFLKSYRINFKEQVSFNNLYYKNKDFPLRFDFKIWYKDKWFLLEIDGLQHNKTVNWNGKLTESEMNNALQENIERDELKNNYCHLHNIMLKRITWNGNKDKLISDLKLLFRNF